MQLERFSGNPILSPKQEHAWEDLAVFNPAVWYNAPEKQVLMLYRAAESHPEYKCFFGLATSQDGYHFERVSDQPVLSPSEDGFDASTIQDPRIVKIGEYYYVTYACRHQPFGQGWLPPEQQEYKRPPFPDTFPRYLRINATLTGLAMTKDFRTWVRAGSMTNPLLDDRDVILFPEQVGGRWVMLHRPLEWIGPEYGCDFPSAWISFADDMLGFRKSQLLIKQEFDWEAGKLGINTPPIRTDHGWLTIYHAVGADKFYRLGALLLDLEHPERVLYRTRDWIMQPEEDYELEGYYRGCCFPGGKFIKDDTLFVYYGGADKYCCLATCPVGELLDYLLSCPA